MATDGVYLDCRAGLFWTLSDDVAGSPHRILAHAAAVWCYAHGVHSEDLGSSVSRSGHERLPDFLIIGAMKSGTTTLYRDLYEHPDIFLPELKEPNSLCDDAVLQPKGRAIYAGLFAKATDRQICGEASTTYTKWPDQTEVPRRARSLLGEKLKLIYLTRDPIERIKSQYAHEYERGLIKQDIDHAVRDVPRLIDYSRYAAQIQRWLEYFPRQNFLLLELERYASDRRSGASRVCEFLELAPHEFETIREERFNSSETRLSVNKAARTLLYRLPYYHQYIQPLIPWQLRRGVSKYLFRTAKKASTEMRPDTVDYIHAALREDAIAYAQLQREQLSLAAVQSQAI